MKKKISLVLLCGVMVLGLCGCGSKEEKLNEMENIIYNSMIKTSKTADSPSDLRLIEVFKKDGNFYINLNKGDGTYCYYVNTSREELSYEYGTCHIAELQNETYDDVSISKVNNKYKKYVEDMGL